MVRLKRIYDRADDEDGTRVLVDRLWPRGVRKEAAGVDWWAKEVAPSKELRTWLHQDPEGRFEAFAESYRRELDGNPALERLGAMASEGTVTLLYASRERERNHARVLAELLGA
ncbi:MAG TPA: DUF488 family protein [Trueperaceae bacterium]|nr:DUF488 family protein [Trueperaceae bacterium]